MLLHPSLQHQCQWLVLLLSCSLPLFISGHEPST
uniref:Uncharacterized protein n=1 Tax=Rhizophora mucronata TaxID=61149 RepID=A0A2P2PHZ5_RHIMU